jgi:23S rRNA pseudouridine2457 synthase
LCGLRLQQGTSVCELVLFCDLASENCNLKTAKILHFTTEFVLILVFYVWRFFIFILAYRYFLVYKPYGVLSQFSVPEAGKIGLGSMFSFPHDVYPVGRLDEDSEGLLLLTNDPTQNARLLGQGVEKCYWVQVEGRPTPQDLFPLTSGMSIRIKGQVHQCLPVGVDCAQEPPALPERIPPIRLRLSVPDSWLKLCLREGKNRQVRRMTAALGFPTLRLVRWSFGPFTIEGMMPGEVRELSHSSFHLSLRRWRWG